MPFYSCFISSLLFTNSLTIKCLVQYFESKITCFQYFYTLPKIYNTLLLFLLHISFHHITGCANGLIMSHLVVSLVN